MKYYIIKPPESLNLIRNFDMKMPVTTTGTSQARSFHGPGPVVLEYKNMKFLITDRPTNTNLPQYITVSILLSICTRIKTVFNLFKLIFSLHFQELKKYSAQTVVRVCEPTYNTESLVKEGIIVVVS